MLKDNISSDELEKLFRDKDESRLKNLCLTLCSGIVDAKGTLLEIIESLENYLTSSDLTLLNFGIDFLANIVQNLPTDFLQENELEFIVHFFCGKVKQHHSFVTAALTGLVALVKNEHLSKDCLCEITSTLFSNVVWQTQSVADRRNFYSILQYIVFNRLEDYKTTSSELIFNIISSVDGERDPRNLLLLFSFIPKLYTTLPLGALTEDAFEVVSCYFPIDFHSPASGPGSVTRDDLVSALNPCLLSHLEFANLCIPLIQEKLESTLKSAKIDSYNLLREGTKFWPSSVVVSYIEALWLAIKSDTLPPRDPQVSDAASQALQALVRIIPDPYQTALLNQVINSCEHFLIDVQMSMFEPSFRLLLTVMQASLTVCSILSKKLLPKLISLLKVTHETSRSVVLNKFIALIQVCLQMNPNFDLGEDGEVWSEVVTCTEEGSADTLQAAYSALALGVTHLDQQSRQRLYARIISHLSSIQSKTVRSSCLKCLQSLALAYDSEIETNILNSLAITNGEQDLVHVQNKFESVCSLAIVEKFHPLVEHQFLSLVSQGTPYISVAILCLRNLLGTEEIRSNKSLLKFLFTKSSIINTLLTTQMKGDDLVNSAEIVRIIVSFQSPSEQERYVLPLVRELLQHSDQTHKMVFLESLLGAMWPEVTKTIPEEVKSHLIPVALHSYETELARVSGLRLLSSLVNKASDDSLLETIAQSIQVCTPHQTTAVCAYITKALVLCGHPLMKHWVDKLVDLLDSEDEDVSQSAAEGFHLLVDESPGLHPPTITHCKIRLLYRQHLFYLTLPRIVSSAGHAQHLKAMAYLLQAVPHTVYIDHMKQIIPLLVKSLDLGSEQLLLTVLSTLTPLLATSDSLLQDHVNTFIPRFLKLARHSAFMQVRIAALKCLSNCLKFSTISLLPHKEQVLAELVPCLDDKKRLVRKEAARTRSKWFLLGAPTSDSYLPWSCENRCLSL